MNAPKAVDAVILTEAEIEIARIGVRAYLQRTRHQYRKNRRNGGTYAARDLANFDAALDLYGRLGGDPEEVIDIEAIEA